MDYSLFLFSLLPTFIALVGLVMWYNIKINERYKSKYRGAMIELGKNKAALNKRIRSPSGGGGDVAGGLDFNSMTLEQAMSSMGFDPKELNNPIVRPIAEKIFNRLKQGDVKNEPTGNEGY